MRVYGLGCLLLAAALAAQGQVAEQHVTAFTLANGLRVAVLERHLSPVIACFTLVGGGSVDDPPGQTGLASLLGGMQLNGSESVGSRNWAEEKAALAALDDAYGRLQAERNKGLLRNEDEYGKLRTQWRLAVDAAQRFSDSREYRRILTEAGADQIHASADYTTLSVSYTLPSNRLELWFAMEAQRLMHPVVRDFDQARAAMIEDRRKAGSDPRNLVRGALLASAFPAHPYRVPQDGWPSDLAELDRRSAQGFLEARYVPGNIVMAVAGDVDPAEARRLAEKYFAAMPARALPPALRTAEPPQPGQRTLILDRDTAPVLAIGYNRPSYLDRDDTALDVLVTLLNSGSTGIARQELVEEKKLVFSLEIAASFPDGQYPNLFTFLLVPAPGHSAADVIQGVDALLFRLRTQKLPPAVVAAARNQIQSQIYQNLASNLFAARMLAIHTWTYGDWKKLFTLAADYGKITEDDLMRVAQRYLNPGNRTVVYTIMPAQRPRGGVQ